MHISEVRLAMKKSWWKQLCFTTNAWTRKSLQVLAHDKATNKLQSDTALITLVKLQPNRKQYGIVFCIHIKTFLHIAKLSFHFHFLPILITVSCFLREACKCICMELTQSLKHLYTFWVFSRKKHNVEFLWDLQVGAMSCSACQK